MAEIPNQSRPRGASTLTIPVDWDAADAVLTIQQPVATAQLGDRIFFEIRGLPDSWIPMLLLSGETAGAGLIRWSQRTSSGLLIQLAEPNSPSSDRIRYTLAVHRGLGAGAGRPVTVSRSAEATLRLVEQAQARTFLVRAVDGQIIVVPQFVPFEPGEVVVWDFSHAGLSAGSPMVVFDRFSGSGDPRNSALGPFSAIETRSDRVVGMGNNGIAGAYFFKVMLVARDGQSVVWVSSVDPVVDNMGEPDAPGSG